MKQEYNVFIFDSEKGQWIELDVTGENPQEAIGKIDGIFPLGERYTQYKVNLAGTPV